MNLQRDLARACHPVLPSVTLAEFCRALASLLADLPDSAAPPAAARYLPGLLANPGLLGPAERTTPATGYGRHCVFACPQDRFSVLAMVWPAGFVSPVHDHAAWCAFGVYEGVLEERRYAPAGDRAVLTTALTHRPGDVDHLPTDAPDIHDMANPTDRSTISIHVYGGNARKMGPNLRKVWPV